MNTQVNDIILITEKWSIVENKLKDIYFFTEQQISMIFHKNSDYTIFNKIIDDVELQYKNIPSDIPINEYLYETLMSIETMDMKKREQTIVDNVSEILDGENVKIISYMDFSSHNSFSDEEIQKNMNNYIEKYTKDFFIIHIDENISVSDKNKDKIASKLIQQYISRSRMSGINFYVFVQKDGIKKIAIGVQKGTTGTSNDIYFSELAEKYNAPMVNIPLSKFLCSV